MTKYFEKGYKDIATLNANSKTEYNSFDTHYTWSGKEPPMYAT